MFRNGCIELATSDPHAGCEKPLLRGKWIVYSFTQAIANNIRCLHALGVDAPYVFSLSFVGVKGYMFSNGDRASMRRPVVLNEDVLIIPDIFIEEADAELKKILKPTFDILWNAFGFEECGFYDDNEKLVE